MFEITFIIWHNTQAWQILDRKTDRETPHEGIGCSSSLARLQLRGSGSPINWLYWLTRCGPQPLQRISASWYKPVHHIGLCALPMLRCSSFLAYTPNWPVALFLLLLHPPGTLYLLTFDCAKTIFSLSNATWKPIYSNSLSPPVLHQAPLYLRT